MRPRRTRLPFPGRRDRGAGADGVRPRGPRPAEPVPGRRRERAESRPAESWRPSRPPGRRRRPRRTCGRRGGRGARVAIGAGHPGPGRRARRTRARHPRRGRTTRGIRGAQRPPRGATVLAAAGEPPRHGAPPRSGVGRPRVPGSLPEAGACGPDFGPRGGATKDRGSIPAAARFAKEPSTPARRLHQGLNRRTRRRFASDAAFRGLRIASRTSPSVRSFASRVTAGFTVWRVTSR